MKYENGEIAYAVSALSEKKLSSALRIADKDFKDIAVQCLGGKSLIRFLEAEKINFSFEQSKKDYEKLVKALEEGKIWWAKEKIKMSKEVKKFLKKREKKNKN